MACRAKDSKKGGGQKGISFRSDGEDRGYMPAFTGNTPLFALKNVAFSVKDKDILTGITCEIPKGGRTVLLGENGCGKTTLMRLLARLNKPTGGKIAQYIDKKFGQNSRANKAWYKKWAWCIRIPTISFYADGRKRDKIRRGE